MGYRLGTYKPYISFLIRFPEPLNKTAELVIPPTLVMPVPSTVRLKPPLLKAEKARRKSQASYLIGGCHPPPRPFTSFAKPAGHSQ